MSLRRPPLRVAAALLGAVLLVGSCVTGDAPTGPETAGPWMVRLPLQASVVPSAADATARPVNRIRATAERVPDGRVLASTVLDVVPTDESWEVTLDVPVQGIGVQVVVSFQLIHVDATGAESVEFSGRTSPIPLVPGAAPTAPTAVSLVRGPADNLAVTSVEITGSPSSLLEGDSVALAATVTTRSPGASPTVFWSVLDATLGSVSGGLVRALLPGTLRVVASAGTHADTVSIAVAPRPAAVSLSPDTLDVVGLGALGTFTGRVLDRRGDPVPGATVTYRSLTPGVAEHRGGGVFAAVGIGPATVEARAVADTSLVARAVFRVAPILTDLGVAKSVAPLTAQPGDTVRHLVTVTNAGPAAVEGVVVSEASPAGLETLSTVASAGSYAAGTWSVGRLASGASATLELTGRVALDASPGVLVNEARVSAPAGYRDTEPSNDQASATLTVVLVAASVSVAPDTVRLRGLGGEGSFTATVRDRRGIALPGSETSWRSLNPSVARSLGGGRFEAVGVGAAEVEASLPERPEVAGRAVLVVEALAADLAVTKSGSREEVAVGDTLTFTVAVSNLGPDAAQGVAVSDALPVGLELVSAQTDAGTFAGGSWSVGALEAGGSATLRVVARATDAGAGLTLVNQAAVSAPSGTVDPQGGNDLASASVRIRPVAVDLAVAKTALADTVSVEGDAVFEITVTNNGPADADQVVVTEQLPPGLGLVSGTPTAGSFDAGAAQWSLALAAGASQRLTVVARAAAGTEGSTLTNRVIVETRGRAFDAAVANNVATAAVRVLAAGPVADVRVAKRVDVATPAEGDTVTYTLVVTNQGPDTATQVVLLDTLPTGLDSVASGPLPAGVTRVGLGLVKVDTLPPGDSVVVALGARVLPGTGGSTIVNTLKVVSLDQTDPAPGNDQATAPVTVAVPPPDVDVVVTKTASPGTVRETGLVTFTVHAANAGTSTATGLVLADTVGGPFAFDSASAGAGSYTPASGLWDIDTLAVGDTATLVLYATVADGSGGTTGSNTARVSALDQADANPANNQATASVTLQKRTLDLSLAKTSSASAPPEGTQVLYTLTLRNHGPGGATNVQVTDSLALLLAVDSASATTGTVGPGATSWTVPSLAAGDSAELRTWVTIGAGAAGTTLTNKARIASLSQADTVAANDTASVAVAIPVSTPPVVTISTPADGASFDPGDTVSFAATANDAEDGDLTSSIVWTSNRAGTIGSGAGFSTSTLAPGPHVIAARVTDLSGTTSADTVQIILAIVGAPPTLNVPFGGSASLPISLSAPAPAGGLTLTVTSSAPGIANPTSSSLVIPAGALSANATIQGILPGAATVSVVSTGYGSATTNVTVTAALNITQGSVSFAQPFSSDITVRLESGGTPIAAPAGGLTVTLTALNPACVAAPTPLTIPAGLVQTTATLTWGGSAATPCSSYVRATATSVVPDSVNVSVGTPPAITVYAGDVGAGLQQNPYVYLGVSQHGGVTLTLKSTVPGSLKVSPDASTPGTDSIVVNVPNGTQYVYYHVQGMEGVTDTVAVTASAPGFASGSANWRVLQPGLYFGGLPGTTTTFSPDNNLIVYIGIPYSNYVLSQPIRAGGTPVTATLVNGNPAAGRLKQTAGLTDTATVTIGVGQSNSPSTPASGGVAFDPVAAGTTTVSATIPGFISQPLATNAVTVSAPAITVYAGDVGAGLQQNPYVYLGASQHGGVTLTLKSTVPGSLKVSPDASTPGTDSIVVNVPNGTQYVYYYVQGMEGVADTVAVTASAPGFTDGSANWRVLQPGLYFGGLPSNTTTFSPDNNLTVYIGIPYSTYVLSQPIRAGGTPVTATLVNSNPAAGRLKQTAGLTDTATVTIGVGQSNSPSTPASGGVAFDPAAAGATTVSATIPGFISQPLATNTITVSAPGITVSAGDVGAGLQQNPYVYLGASQHGGVTLTLKSTVPGSLKVSPDASTPGTDSIVVNVPNGTQYVYYWVQGMEGVTDTVAVTATAPGFTDGSANWRVLQPGLYFGGLPSNTTTFSTDNNLVVYIGIPYSTYVLAQPIRAGGTPVTATLTSSTPSVGLLTTALGSSGMATVNIGVGQSNSPNSVGAGGVAFDPLGAGSTTVAATIPGFIAQPLATNTITVSAPSITVSTGTVGAGLQVNPYVLLGAAQHGGVALTIKSSAPGILRVSPDAVTPGTDSIVVNVPNGTQYVYYYVQGIEGTTGSAVVTASAAGFTDGSGVWNVAPAALAISGLNTTTTAGAADDPFDVRVGIASGNGVSVQDIRAGGAPLVATVTSSTPAAGRLTVTAGPAASVTVTIPVGSFRSATTVAGGGVAFDPLAAGSTTVTATIPGLVAQPDATRVVTINP